MTDRSMPLAAPGSFRRYSNGRVTLARLAAAGLVTALAAVAGAFVCGGSTGPARLALVASLAMLSVTTWIVVLRQPRAIVVGSDVTIDFPFGQRRYPLDDLQTVERVEQSGGYLFVGMHTTRTACWVFRMRDGRCYVVPVDRREGQPG